MLTQDIIKFSPGSEYFKLNDCLRNLVDARSLAAFEKGDADRDAVRSKEELEKRQKFMRENLIDALGGLPSNENPLNPVVTGIVQCDGFKIEKVIFESRPKVYVTANLYVPDGIKAPTGAVLFVCGHHEQAKHHPEYQIVCQYLVRAGLVVLAQDPVGQGERFSYYEKSIDKQIIGWGVVEHSYAGMQCLPLGDCIARYFVHDAIRGIDYLCSRSEVDPARIGVTGNSGGGTQASLVMLCDPRVAAAAPGTFIMNRKAYVETSKAQDMEQIWPKMTGLGFDHEDILMAMVPRPVLVLAVKYDFFPIEGTRRTVERTRRFWEMYGKADNVGLVEDFSEHCYTRRLAKASAEFFSLHLLGSKVSPEDNKVVDLEPSKLWCTKSGQVRGEIEDARFVFEENLERLMEMEAKRSKIPEAQRKKAVQEWLKEKVYGKRISYDLNPRILGEEQMMNLSVQVAFWWSQKTAMSHAFLFRDFRFAGKELPVTIALWAGGTENVIQHIGWLRETCSKGRSVMVLDVSGDGALSPLSTPDFLPAEGLISTLYKYTTDLIWMDDSLAALRIYDVLRALDVVNKWPGLKKECMQLYGNGRHGMYVLLAALLDKRIEDFEIADGPESFKEWVGERYFNEYDIISYILPGVLKYFDLPELKKWVRESIK